MQKRIRIVSVGIILIVLFISVIISNNNINNKHTFKKDGILYALSLDGNSITSFPSKGLYKANVSCNGADGRWLYDDWKLAIENITGDVSCDIKFETITKTYLNNYITSLAGTIQGTGQVVKEIASVPNFSSYVAISQSSYASQSVFSSSYASATNGTSASGVYTFANNTWTSVPGAMTSGTYYHFKFNPNENGYYQMCYDLSAGNTNNSINAYVNNDSKYFGDSRQLLASTSTAKNGCIELGYVSTSDYIEVTQRAYTDISTLSFSIKKASSISAADIRYEGKNPNNYVWFNNEYWRIIGVFDSASHGQNNKNLVKIIRADVLDGLAWHKSDTNDWTSASLNKLLNGAYYNAQDGTSSGYCYGYSTTTTANCDYTKKGIQAGYRGMIANVTWYLGGYSSTDISTEAFYGYERGTIVYSGRPTSTTGYIGLMYPSDYGYSMLASSCPRTTIISSSGSDTWAGTSWLYGKGDEWMLSPLSNESNVFFTVYDGRVSITIAEEDNVVRPVLYLDTSVYKIDGEGTLDKPYIIGM